MKIAVLSDIHANSWALKAVLKDISIKRPDMIVDLGDSLYGPLNPKETFELIKSHNITSISGNQDRYILEGLDGKQDNQTLRFVIEELNDEAFNWLGSLPKTRIINTNVFMCHGTPHSDNIYLLEQLYDKFVTVNDTTKIEELLQGVNQKIVFCGHSHTHRVIQTPDRIIVNPGSVGLPAYDDDLPIYHKIESFNNNAQYCIVDLFDNEIKIEQMSIPYDFNEAVESAVKNKRLDWAKWIKTGRV